MVRYLCSSVFICGCFCFSLGCADSNRPESTKDRQERALSDPMGYKTDTEKVDISGGDIGHFDKGGFKKDVNDVLSP